MIGRTKTYNGEERRGWWMEKRKTEIKMEGQC